VTGHAGAIRPDKHAARNPIHHAQSVQELRCSERIWWPRVARPSADSASPASVSCAYREAAQTARVQLGEELDVIGGGLRIRLAVWGPGSNATKPGERRDSNHRSNHDCVSCRLVIMPRDPVSSLCPGVCARHSEPWTADAQQRTVEISGIRGR
jgi:hypothetical protein